MDNEVSKLLQPLSKRRNVVVLVSALYIIIGLIPPYLVGMLIDDLYPQISEYSMYVFMILTIVSLLILCFALNWLQGYLREDLINRGAGIARGFFFASVLRKGRDFFPEHSVGDIDNKVLNDSYIYVKSKLMMIPTLYLNILHIVVLFGFLLYLNVYMKLMVLAFSIVFFFIYTKINKKLRINSIREREGFSALLSEANETFQGIETFQLYRAEKFAAGYFQRLVDSYERSLTKLKFWQTLSSATTDAVMSVVPVAAIVAGILFLTLGGDITVGRIVAFYYFLPRLRDPIKALTDFNIDLQNARAVKQRLEELVPDGNREEAPLDSIDRIESLEFVDLGFTFPDGEKVLQSLSVQLRRGDCLAVAGPSGAGKTSLMRLLTRQITPTEGEILINGNCYTNIDYDSYLSRIAVLPQDVFVIDATLHDNIAFGKDFSEKLIREAAQLSVIDSFSMDERARNLSGGERQRIGLARAIVRDFDVLILDEPTSELDHETEWAIIENLKEIQRKTNCIMIVITHSDYILEGLCTKKLELTRL